MDDAAYNKLCEALLARLSGQTVGISFPGVDLSGAKLNGAELGGANLSGCSLTLASLAGANLARANLELAVLHAADLGGADLTNAQMAGVDLSKAQLDDAVLANADLRGAYLRDTRGEPLSMVGARIDQAAITRSGLSDSDINILIARGAIFENPESLPPLAQEVISMAPPSFISELQRQERESRRQAVDLQPEARRSSRKIVHFLTQLVEEARVHKGLPMSLLHRSLPQVGLFKLRDASHPEVGLTYMGVKLDEELPGASIARTFTGMNQEGQRVLVKTFDPLRHGAALHLPAFQRGLRAMNRAGCQAQDGPKMMDLLAVSPDLTAYVARYYEGGTLAQLVNLEISLDTGLRLFEEVCKSFAAVHRMGALVRAIKPSNILFEGLKPVLTEIDMIDLPTMREVSSSACGYAAYAAPEELTRTGTRSPTADVFALGKLLEYLLTGQEPVDAVSGESMLKERTGIPEFLVQLVARCTAADPAERFQEVGDILAEVARFRSEGSAAQLRAPMRVATLSRVLSLHSLLPGEQARIFGPPVIVNEEECLEEALPKNWMVRPLELGLSSLALVGLLMTMSVIWLAPSNVEFVERAWFVACLIAGCALWLLPPPSRSLRALRLATWAAAALAMFVLGPMPLARARWNHDLKVGPIQKKESAVTNLVRSGVRTLAHKNLDRVSLVSHDLSSIEFKGTSLRNANLSHSLLRESNFEQADLDSAQVYGADLRLANLEGARGLAELKCDDETLFPSGFQCKKGRANWIER